MSISALAKSCDRKLSDVIDRIDDKSPHASKYGTMNESLGRLRVWANNLGAYQNPTASSSLDYRLRAAQDMREVILDELGTIRDWAIQFEEIVNDKLPNRIISSTPGENDEQDTIEKTELDELVYGIDGSMTALFRLSMVIRQNRPKGRTKLPESMERGDPTIDVRHVLDKYPKTKSEQWLAERLGKSTAERRDVIRYRQGHLQRLAASHLAEDLLSDDGVPIDPTIATTYEAVEREDQRSPNDEDVTRRSMRTTATSFVSILEEGGDEFNIPDLERFKFNDKLLKYDEPFECPFCRTIQELGTYHDWKAHVFSDLQPYTCTFKDCPSEFFATRHEWFEHEISVHRREWFCFECNDEFRTDAEVASHLDKRHHVGNVLQMPFLLEACQRPIRYFGQGSCQLCDEWAPAVRTEDNTKEFRRHLGHHLQSLALSAVEGQFIEGLDLVEGGEDEEGGGREDKNEEEEEEEEEMSIPTFITRSLGSITPTIFLDDITTRQSYLDTPSKWKKPTVNPSLDRRGKHDRDERMSSFRRDLAASEEDGGAEQIFKGLAAGWRVSRETQLSDNKNN